MQSESSDRLKAFVAAFSTKQVNATALNRVAVSRKHRFIYNRVKKNANSHLMTFLHFLQSGKIEGVIKSRNSVLHMNQLSDDQIAGLNSYRRLLVIRSPYSRVLSAFLDKFRSEKITRSFGAFPLTPDGFGSFLNWLADGGLSANDHWNLQSKEILLPLDKYSDVVRFEQLDSELTAFFTSVGVAASDMDRVVQHGRDHQTAARKKLHAFYDVRRAEIVADLYRSDFQALGYDRAQIL